MLIYYSHRLESTYIPNLRSGLKDCDSISRYDDDDRFATARQGLDSLRQLTFTIDTQTLLERHDMLVTKAYELRMAKLVQELLQTSPQATKQSKKLWIDICSLGRLRVAFQKFGEISRKLPSVSKVTIIPVSRDFGAQEPLEGPLNLNQVFGLLGIPLNPLGIRQVIGPKWTVTRAQKEFTKLQKQRLNVHAEIQMVLHFSKDGQSFGRVFPYFGCSKQSCFMCWHFLQAHSKFRTRGCHGRLFKPWSVPESQGLARGQAEKITKALLQIQGDLRKKLRVEFKRNIAQAKTSVVGATSVFSDHDSTASQRQAAIERRKMEAARERVSETFRR
jgi:hypothetical protein